MANLTSVGLLDLTGMIPCANRDQTQVSTEQGNRSLTTVGAGSVAIPLNSLTYTGVAGAHWQPIADGTLPGVTDSIKNGAGAGNSLSTDKHAEDYLKGATGSYQNFMRAIHETAVSYTQTALTGNNALKYWGESQGNYSIFDQTALTRKYTTDLYYSLGDDQGGKNSQEIS